MHHVYHILNPVHPQVPLTLPFRIPQTPKLLSSSKDPTINELLNYCKRSHTDLFPSFFTPLCPIFHVARGILL